MRHSLTSLLAASSSSSSSSNTVNLIISGSRLHRADRLSATAPLRLATELCSASASGMMKGPEYTLEAEASEDLTAPGVRSSANCRARDVAMLAEFYPVCNKIYPSEIRGRVCHNYPVVTFIYCLICMSFVSWSVIIHLLFLHKLYTN